MDAEFKSPSQENGTNNEKTTADSDVAEIETNGTKNPEPRKRQRRSRSKTPQTKRKPDETKKLSVTLTKLTENGNENDEEKINGDKQETEQNVEVEPKENGDKVSEGTNSQKDEEVEMMEPLVLTSDEVEPEQQVEEDLEAGKVSPVFNRSRTRLQLKKKTPEVTKDVEVENIVETSTVPIPEITIESPPKDSTPDSTLFTNTNSSLKVEIGSDATRLAYLQEDSGLNEDNSEYLTQARDRSLSEHLRGLSRRSIRPISQDYRKQTFKKKTKTGLNLSSYDSLERINTGTKRKFRSSETPEDTKRFKPDSPGLFSKFTSPLANLRNRFRFDIPSSTPKLTGYKEGVSGGEGCPNNQEIDKKSWCSVM